MTINNFVRDIFIIILYLFRLTIILDYPDVVRGVYTSNLTVRKCLNESFYKKYPCPRRIPLEMSAYREGQPNTMTIWELYSLSRNRTEKLIRKERVSAIFGIFAIEAFSLKAGDYKIKIHALPKDKGNEEPVTCFVYIPQEGALALINGGTTRNINPGVDILVDGSTSMDFCNPKGKKALVYKWQCTQLKNGEFCKNLIAKGPKFTIPGKYIVDEDIITVNLTIRNTDKKTSMTYQKLIVKKHSSQLAVWCTSNCPPIVRSPNIRRVSSFAASCGKCCDECKVNWQLYKGIVNPVKIPISETCSSTSCSFSVNEGIGEYKVIVSCIGAKISGETTLALTFQKEPQFSCELDKKSGTSFDVFSLICTFEDQEQIEHFDVYASGTNSREKGEFLTSWSPPFVPRFRLDSRVKKICVQAFNINGTVGEILLSVTVTPHLDTANSPPITKIKSLHFDSANYSVRHAIEQNDVDETLSKIISIWSNIHLIKRSAATNIEFQELIHDLKLYAINEMEQIPIKSFDTLTQVTSTIDKVNSYQTPHKADPFLAMSLTKLCKKMANYMTKLLKENEYPAEVAHKTTIISNALLECESENFNDDLDSPTVIPKIAPEHIYEPVPFEETITENYEAYEEIDERYFGKLANIIEAVNNSLITNFLIADTVVRTMPSNSKVLIRNSTNMQQLVYKYREEYIPRIAMDGIELIPSVDILKYRDKIFLSLTVWKKNMFWFSFNEDIPVTYIANLDFVLMNNRSLLNVKRPHVITMEVIKQPEGILERINGIVKVPLEYLNGTEREDEMEEYLKIHRISLFRYQALKIDFHDMEEMQFLVVVKNFDVPTYGDFQNDSILFHRNHTSKYFRNDNSYDSWFYVAILPTREMVLKFVEANSRKVDELQFQHSSVTNDSPSFPYEVTFSSVSCYSWSFIKDWERTCKVGNATNDTHITCECDHLSVLSGYRQGVSTKEVNVEQVAFEIEVQDYYLILIQVLVMLIVFCFLMMCFKPLTEKSIYYAADNDYNHLYAYLIVVQSGGHRKTTSRVVIKITGAVGITTHVLNYPDPECKILQHGMEDWIVVTTKQCLGAISEIVLWQDDHGIEPIWMCNNIIIYDMQTYQNWFFKINDTMSACHKSVLVVHPYSIKKRQRGAFKERHSWNMFTEDAYKVNSYMVRLTLTYAKLITPLTIIMFYYGLPLMDASDSIDVYTFFAPDGFFAMVAVGAGFASFFFYLLLTSIFYAKILLLFIIPIILFCNSALVIYGLWIPHYKNMYIVAAWLLAVTLDICVYENMYRIVKEYFLGTTKISDTAIINFKEIEKEFLIQREFVYENVGNKFVRDLENLRAFKKIAVVRKEGMDILRLQKLRYQLSELIIFGTYIFLLYLCVLWSKDIYVYQSHRSISLLAEGEFTRSTPKLSQVMHLSDIAKYINHTFIEGLNHDVWYGAFYLKDPGLLADFNSKMIGVARVRQHRVRSYPCEPAFEEMSFLTDNISCYPRFSSGSEESRHFDGQWGRLSTDNGNFLAEKRNRTMWMFRHLEDSGSGSFAGEMANYYSGSYNLWLGRNRQNSLKNFKLVEANNWIDRQTRCIQIEMLTYNANYNMFCASRVAIERSSSGVLHAINKVQPVRMLFVYSGLQQRAIAAFSVFAAWVVILLMYTIKAFVSRGVRHMKSFWNLLDLTIIGLSVCMIILYLLRMNEVQHILDYLELHDHNDFIVYFHLFVMNDILEAIGAVLFFLSTVRLWKLLRFLRILQIFEKTITFGLAPYLVLIFYHFLVHFWFSITSYILFGDHLQEFRSVKVSTESLVRIYMANFHEYDFIVNSQAYSLVGIMVASTFMLLCKPIYRFYVAAEMIAYIDAGLDTGGHAYYSFIDYVKDEAGFLFSVYKSKIKRLRGGEAKTKRNVWPKKHDIFYSNCVSTTTSSIKKMTFITMVLLKNLARGDVPKKRTLGDDEANLMLKICHYFLVSRKYYGDSKEVFFKAYSHEDGTKRLNFIDHRRMTSARLVAETILVRAGTKPPKELLIYEHELVLRENIELLNHLLKSLKNCLEATKEIIIR